MSIHCAARLRLSIVLSQVDTLYCGEVGYLAAQIKSVQDARVGDTVTLKKTPAPVPLAGYEDVQPMVYCGLFPTNSDDYQVRAGIEGGVGALGTLCALVPAAPFMLSLPQQQPAVPLFSGPS